MNTQNPIKLRRPRDYAAAILAESSRERRKQLLERCPAEWRDQVREHVEANFDRVRAYRQHREERCKAAHQRPEAARRRTDPPAPIIDNRSEPEVGNRHLAALRAKCSGGAQ